MSNWINRFVENLIGSEICFICGRHILNGNYYKDHFGNVSCGSHSIAMCFGCTSICDMDSSIYVSSYGYLCSKCSCKEIDSSTAIRLVEYVCSFYLNLGMSLPGHKLHLTTIEEMKQRSSGNSEGVLGLAYSKENGVYRVCVLRNLSKIAFAGVFAHEILHLWQYGKNIFPPSPICEGFCNLGEYLVLGSIDKAEAQRRMANELQNPDPVYGEGFRALKVIYDTKGWDKVIETLYGFQRIK